MAAKAYLRLVSGRIRGFFAVVTSAGAGNDGDIPALDATGKLDASMMPSGFGQNTENMVTSEAIGANAFVNFWNSAGTAKCRNADATTEGKEANGFVKAAFGSGASATVFLSGNTNTGLSGMTPGARQFLVVGSAGTRTETPPATSANVVQCLGVAASATDLLFEPESPVTVA